MDIEDLRSYDEMKKDGNIFMDIILHTDGTGGNPSVLGDLCAIEINFATGWLYTSHVDANNPQRILVGYVIPLYDSDFVDTVREYITQAEEWMVKPEKHGRAFTWRKPERTLGI